MGVLDLLLGDDGIAVKQLLADHAHTAFQLLEEPIDIALALDGDTGQIDRGEGQIAAAEGDLVFGIIDIAHDAGTAAHVSDLGLGMAGLVILQIEGCVDEAEVGE